MEAPLLSFKDDVEVAVPNVGSVGNLMFVFSGHLHKRREGKGHRSQTETGDSGLGRGGTVVFGVQSTRRIAAERYRNRRNNRSFRG